MIQRGYGERFPLETIAESCGRSLNGDSAVEPRVAGLVHLAHASNSDGGEDFVGTEFVAC